MHLQRLEIQGFKSFADKVVFDFPEAFTAIVGPNGSGKSNVADAIRWVLGEQSMKLLRCKKAGDIIFHGSQKKSRLGFARADLYLSNEDRRLDVDYSEVVITRILYGDGESEYYLNKNKVTLGEILLLLARAHFGQKSYAVIGQGMVETTLNSTPQGRKYFFDEAAGVKALQMKRDQSLHKLLRTEDNLKQARGLLQEIEPHLRSLERQAKKLNRREKIEKEFQEIQVQYYGSAWHTLCAEEIANERTCRERESDKISLEEKLAKILKRMDAIGKGKTQPEMYAELQKRIKALEQRKQEILTQLTRIEGRREIEQEKYGHVNIAWLTKKQTEMMHEQQAVQKELASMEYALSRAEKQFAAKQAEQEKTTSSLRAVEYELLKAKESLQTQDEVTLSEVRRVCVTLYHQQEVFLQKLLRTNDLQTFQGIKKLAKELTLRFAELVDLLTHKEKHIPQPTSFQELQRAFQQALKYKEDATQQTQDARVQYESLKTRRDLAVETIARKKAEYEKITSELRSSETLLQKKDYSDRLSALHKEGEEFKRVLQDIEPQLQKLYKEIEQLHVQEQEKKDMLITLQHEARVLQDSINVVSQKLEDARIERTRVHTKKEDMLSEMQRELSAGILAAAQKFQKTLANAAELEGEMERLAHQLELIGGIDPDVIKEYTETNERYEFLSKQVEDLEKALKDLEHIIEELDVTIHKQFSQSFRLIDKHFHSYFQVLFGGGQAHLKLLTEASEAQEGQTEVEGVPQNVASAFGDEGDSNEELSALAFAPTQTLQRDQLNEEEHLPVVQKILNRQKKIISGIEIFAIPPGKKTKHVQSLSGGEKALTALALLAAILETNPAPFVVLDEVEAALDEANSEKFAAILKKLSSKMQFIVITHNRVTMHHADTLYGVTLGSQCASCILSLKLEDALVHGRKLAPVHQKV